MSCTPVKVIRLDVVGNCNAWTALLDTSDRVEPESSRARATNVLPPGPFRSNLLVIIKKSVGLEEVAELVEALESVLWSAWWTRVLCLAAHSLQVPGFLHSVFL